MLLMQYLRTGGKTNPGPNSTDSRQLEKIPNLVWKDADGVPHINPLSYTPDNLDDLLMDYSRVVRAVVRYRDLSSVIPFKGWIKYPITGVLTVRGCRLQLCHLRRLGLHLPEYIRAHSPGLPFAGKTGPGYPPDR